MSGTCVLQMWAYLATYEMPNDDPEALERRVRVAYPVRVDRCIGGGTTPTLRLQRALGRAGRLPPLGEGARLVALALVRRSRTAPSLYLLAAPPRPLPARRRARCTRRSTSG